MLMSPWSPLILFKKKKLFPYFYVSVKGMQFHKDLCPYVGSPEFCSPIRRISKIYAELDHFVVNVFSCIPCITPNFFTSNFKPMCILADAFAW